MATAFRLDPQRDAWERQPGEPAAQYDWFQHWMADGHRRSCPRTAEKFRTTTAKVRGAKQRYQWQRRFDAWKSENSAQVRERFDDLVEQGLAPFAQGFARLAALAAKNPGDGVSPDKAGQAAAAMLRVAKEPTTRELLSIAGAGENTDLAVGDTILSALDDYPEAKQAALDALRNADGDHQ